ncbi:MAG: YeeE/YedE family protein [Deltaproteobacteria bacterium]|nr:YeeE/YedE family protein [Deltaproteobacteria bacterium]
MATESSWRPYVAGALVGVLAVLSVYVSTAWLGKTKYLGASTSFVRAAGMVEQKVAPERVQANDYFTRTKIKVDWQFMLLVGLLIGSLASSLITRTFKFESVPPIWRERFGGSILTRAGGAFLGGIVAMFGARLAGGCPSGHGLSGLMQFSVSGFLAMAGFFGAGIIVAHLVYGSRR